VCIVFFLGNDSYPTRRFIGCFVIIIIIIFVCRW
jgi:hypothetical protein